MDKNSMAEWRKITVATPLPFDSWDETLKRHRERAEYASNAGLCRRLYKKVKSLMGMSTNDRF